MGKKRSDFSKHWSNQTKLGQRFGLSGVGVGKILAEHGLKTGSGATQQALDGGYAKATPLADGTPHFMWSVEKVSALLSKSHSRVSEIDRFAALVKAQYRSAERLQAGGDDKLAILTADAAYDDVPHHLLQAVRAKVEAGATDAVAS